MTHQVLNLQSGDAPFRADPAQSYTLPARFYHDPTVFELEKDAIFYKSWWYAGHVSQVTEPGSFLTTRIHEQNILRARDKANCARFITSVRTGGINWSRV